MSKRVYLMKLMPFASGPRRRVATGHVNDLPSADKLERHEQCMYRFSWYRETLSFYEHANANDTTRWQKGFTMDVKSGGLLCMSNVHAEEGSFILVEVVSLQRHLSPKQHKRSQSSNLPTEVHRDGLGAGGMRVS